tara:strand:+ start:2304 stop:2531 length:228 start_codon:yes stop_codon:yes gene_type:complete
METKKLVLWWFLYQVLGVLASVGIGFVGGFFGGFFGAMFGLPDSFAILVMIVVIICASISNFFIFKWSVNKLIEN